jgi:hypothetical protein
MDIALRTAGIYRRGELNKSRNLEIYCSLSTTAHALVRCYSDSISGKTSITQEEGREVVQAADFLIKEARKVQQRIGVGINKTTDSLLDQVASFFLATKRRAGR